MSPSNAALEQKESLLREALKFNPQLRTQVDIAALEVRNASERREWNSHIAAEQQARDASAEWNSLLASGRIRDAVTSYARFESRHPTTKIPAESWNRLCWFGSLHDNAGVVMAACDRAGSMRDDAWPYRDSRGLARALTGDRQGAIADWQY